MKPIHDRRIVVLRPEHRLAWLDLAQPEGELRRPLPHGALATVRPEADKRLLARRAQ